MKKYTDNQINKLKENKYIIGINNNGNLIYSPVFKLWAVKQRINYPYLTVRTIFEMAGFDFNIISLDNARRLLRDWEKVFYNRGLGYFYGEIEKYNHKLANMKNDQDSESSDTDIDEIVLENNELLKLILDCFSKLLKVLNEK